MSYPETALTFAFLWSAFVQPRSAPPSNLVTVMVAFLLVDMTGFIKWSALYFLTTLLYCYSSAADEAA